MGDSNAHHPLWYGPEEVYRIKIYGEVPLPILLQNGLKITVFFYIGPGVHTHFPLVESSNPSVVDLCLSRGRITQYIETWTIDKNSRSDHVTVGLTYSRKYSLVYTVFVKNKITMI
jgi:hypothetical protein